MRCIHFPSATTTILAITSTPSSIGFSADILNFDPATPDWKGHTTIFLPNMLDLAIRSDLGATP